MKIVVSGGTGFIGSHLIPELIASGHQISVLKRKQSDLKRLSLFAGQINIINFGRYEDICAGFKTFVPDLVIHLAALYINEHNPGDIAALIDSNISFGTHILEAMKEANIKKFLNIGTRWQHIGNKRYRPANLYAATKQAFKDILIYYEASGICHKTIELADTYGEGDTRRKVLDLLLNACRKNEKIDLSPGEQELDLSYVGDICEFIKEHIDFEDFYDNKTITLSGTVIKLRDLGQLVEDKFKVRGVLNWGGKAYREHEVMAPPIYYRKIRLKQNSLEAYVEKAALKHGEKLTNT